MIEQFGPAADAEVAYLQERARASYHGGRGGTQHETLLHWVRRRTHRADSARP
jgi:hypothetical protein